MHWLAGFPIPDDWTWFAGTGSWLVAYARDGRLGFIAERRRIGRSGFEQFVKERRRCWHRLPGQSDFCARREEASLPIVAQSTDACSTLETAGSFSICGDVVSYSAVAAIVGDATDGWDRAAELGLSPVAVMATSLDGPEVVATLAMAVAEGGALGAAGAAESLRAMVGVAGNRLPPSPDVSQGARLKFEPRNAEHARIVSALAAAHGHKTRAAVGLGMSRRSFVEKLRLYSVCWKDR